MGGYESWRKASRYEELIVACGLISRYESWRKASRTAELIVASGLIPRFLHSRPVASNDDPARMPPLQELGLLSVGRLKADDVPAFFGEDSALGGALQVAFLN